VRHRWSQVVHPAQVESMTHQGLLKGVVQPQYCMAAVVAAADFEHHEPDILPAVEAFDQYSAAVVAEATLDSAVAGLHLRIRMASAVVVEVDHVAAVDRLGEAATLTHQPFHLV